jgi:Xaa-Pro dipeptidase
MRPAPCPIPFSDTELRDRQEAIGREIDVDGADVLVLTAQSNIEYLTGYRSLSWAYHSRPIMAILTGTELVLVAARTETRNLAQSERRFRTAFYDGYLTECVDCVLAEVRRKNPRCIAIDWGADMFGRGSVSLAVGLQLLQSGGEFISGADAIWRVRRIKSAAELARKSIALEIASDAFDRAIAQASPRVTEIELVRQVQAFTMVNGADCADPIAMVFGTAPIPYNRWPSERALEPGDYVWTDLRARYGGYPADKNRLARAGRPEAWERDLYATIRALTLELGSFIRPDMTCAEIYSRFERLWREAALPPIYGLVSRIGHGGGLDVTEPPSISSDSSEMLEPGMVLHLEPKLEKDGAIFQFEEVVAVTETGATFLGPLSPPELPVIE